MNSKYYKNIHWLPSLKNEDEKISTIFSKNKINTENLFKLQQIIKSRLSYSNEIKLKNFLKKKKIKQFKKINIGVLSNSNYFFLKDALEFSGLRKNLNIEVHFAKNNKILETALSKKKIFNTESRIDFVLLAIDYHLFNFDDCFNSKKKISTQVFEQIKLIINTIKSKLNCSILTQTISPPPFKLFSNHELQTQNSVTKIIEEVNKKIINYSLKSKSFIFDIAGLSSEIGTFNWHDQTAYNLGELPFSNDYASLYCDKLSNLISVILGNIKKVLVIDLDDTIWGGNIGDLGYEGIKIGYSDPESKSFLNIQKLLLKLKKRGILLAVCSKNDLSIAKSAFTSRQDMILKLKDISSFKANWDEKPKNIIAIAKELNIGLNAMVFFDNNYFERDFVRKSIPDIEVPELSEEPSNYERDLIFPGYFEITNLSKEDKKRSYYYESNRKREQLKNNSVNLEKYLHSLKMRANIRKFDKKNIDRIVQLIMRSNQFNLTTKRYDKNKIERIIRDKKKYHTLQSNLIDKFGDNGIVSLIICEIQKKTVKIDSWIMSCRVFSRNLEITIFNKLVSNIKKIDAKYLIGEYYKTEKNIIVENLYKELGFKCVKKRKDYSKWSLNLEEYKLKENNNIKIF